MKVQRFAAATMAACVAISSAYAQIEFNFEEFGATSGAGALTSLTSTQGGVTMTVTRLLSDNLTEGATFDIQDISPYIPAGYGWGARTLNPFYRLNDGSFHLTFSVAVGGIDIQLGDGGVDADLGEVKAYVGTDYNSALAGQTSFDWGYRNLSNDPPLTATIDSATRFRSVYIRGGSAGFQNSLYYDRIVIRNVVPEPASFVVLGVAVGAFIRRRRCTR